MTTDCKATSRPSACERGENELPPAEAAQKIQLRTAADTYICAESAMPGALGGKRPFDPTAKDVACGLGSQLM